MLYYLSGSVMVFKAVLHALGPSAINSNNHFHIISSLTFRAKYFPVLGSCAINTNANPPETMSFYQFFDRGKGTWSLTAVVSYTSWQYCCKSRNKNTSRYRAILLYYACSTASNQLNITLLKHVKTRQRQYWPQAYLQRLLSSPLILCFLLQPFDLSIHFQHQMCYYY